jgi:hypothetical protein
MSSSSRSDDDDRKVYSQQQQPSANYLGTVNLGAAKNHGNDEAGTTSLLQILIDQREFEKLTNHVVFTQLLEGPKYRSTVPLRMTNLGLCDSPQSLDE